MTKLKDLKTRFMEDSAFREEYARIDEEYALIEALVRARTAAKLTQAELAQRLGTTQSAVARLEGGAGVAVLRDAAPLRRGDRNAADRGPGAVRRLREGERRLAGRAPFGPGADGAGGLAGVRTPGQVRGTAGDRRRGADNVRRPGPETV